MMFQYNSCYCSIICVLKTEYYTFQFQYNSCYCSILSGGEACLFSACFNTTLVTVLYEQFHLRSSRCCVSIQLLLLFYDMTAFSDSIFDSFNTTLVTVLFSWNYYRFSWNYRFNTTLVTVLWRLRSKWSHISKQFQYNSCYCSIKVIAKKSNYNLMFQYNSCYCSICIP